MAAFMAIMATWMMMVLGGLLALPITYGLYRWAGGKKSLWRWVATL